MNVVLCLSRNKTEFHFSPTAKAILDSLRFSFPSKYRKLQPCLRVCEIKSKLSSFVIGHVVRRSHILSSFLIGHAVPRSHMRRN